MNNYFLRESSYLNCLPLQIVGMFAIQYLTMRDQKIILNLMTCICEDNICDIYEQFIHVYVYIGYMNDKVNSKNNRKPFWNSELKPLRTKKVQISNASEHMTDNGKY